MSDQFLEGADIENKHRPPFFMIDNRLHDEWMPVIGVYAFSVYCSLVRRADTQGACYPSSNRVAQDLGISARTVIRAMQVLEEHGLIKRHARYIRDTRERTSDRIVILPVISRPQVYHDSPEVLTHSQYLSSSESVPTDSQSGGTDLRAEEEDRLTRPREEEPQTQPSPPPHTATFTVDSPDQPTFSSGESVSPQEVAPNPLPRKEKQLTDIQKYVEWWRVKVNLPTVSQFPKHAAAAKRLITAEVTLEDLDSLFDFCAFAGVPDLGVMSTQVDRWRAKKTAPRSNPKNAVPNGWRFV